MRLEDSSDVLVLIKLTNALGALINLLGMMGIVAKEYHLAVFDLESETTLNTGIGLHTDTQLLCRTTGKLSHCHCSNTVFYVDGNRLTKLYAFYTLDGRDEVKCDFAILYYDILCMEIAFVETVVITAYARLYILFHLKAAMDDKGTTWLDEFGVMTEALKISLFCSVDIQMIGVAGCYDAHPRTEPVE